MPAVGYTGSRGGVRWPSSALASVNREKDVPSWLAGANRWSTHHNTVPPSRERQEKLRNHLRGAKMLARRCAMQRPIVHLRLLHPGPGWLHGFSLSLSLSLSVSFSLCLCVGAAEVRYKVLGEAVRLISTMFSPFFPFLLLTTRPLCMCVCVCVCVCGERFNLYIASHTTLPLVSLPPLP